MTTPATSPQSLPILEAIALRTSVREFRPDPVPEELLLTLLDAANQAPSSMNVQPWEFILVTSPEAKQALSTATSGNNQNAILTAGATFVCLGSMRQQDALANRLEQRWITPDATPERIERVQRSLKRLREDETFRKDHVLTNTYIGITQLVLAAQGLGLSSLWMGGFDAAKVKEVMGIPEDYLVASLISVGYAAQEPSVKPRDRRPLGEIAWRNHFGQR